MSTVDQLREEGQTLREQKQFAQALVPYQRLWEEFRDDCSDWDVWGYAHCLRKAGRSAEGLDICREAYRQWPDFEPMRNVYGWSIYDLEIKGKHDDEIAQNEGQFLKAANAICDLTEPGQYSPYVRAVMRVTKYLGSRPGNHSERLLSWGDRLRPDQLSLETGVGKDDKGRVVELASDREKWYADRTKALLVCGRYEICLDLGAQALADVPKFHYNNDIWIQWRMALSEAQLGETTVAIGHLKEILARKRDWFVQRDLAQMLYDEGQFEESLRYATDAALNGPDLQFKGKLFLLMAEVCRALGEVAEGKQHVLLAAAIAQEKAFKVSGALEAAMAGFGVELEPDVSSSGLHKELRKIWLARKLAELPQMQGKVHKLMVGGMAGFINGDDGKDYYFKTTAFKGPKDAVGPGLRVSFHIEVNPAPDKCDTAIHLVSIKE